MSRFANPLPKPVVDRAIAELVAGGSLVLESERNQPNGFAGLDASGNLLGTVTHRRGTAAEINAIVLADGELAFVTDLNELRRGDGSTVGGVLVGPSIRRYATASGGVALLSTAPDYVQAIPCVLNGAYKIEGTLWFSSDTDNQSNFSFGIRRANGLLFGQFGSPVPGSLIQTQHANVSWFFNGDTAAITVLANQYSATNSMPFAPPVTTKASAIVSFAHLFGVSAAGNLEIFASRRTTAIGSPNIRIYGSYIVTRLF